MLTLYDLLAAIPTHGKLTTTSGLAFFFYHFFNCSFCIYLCQAFVWHARKLLIIYHLHFMTYSLLTLSFSLPSRLPSRLPSWLSSRLPSRLASWLPWNGKPFYCLLFWFQIVYFFGPLIFHFWKWFKWPTFTDVFWSTFKLLTENHLHLLFYFPGTRVFWTTFCI